MAYLNNGDTYFSTDIAARSNMVEREIINGIFWKNMIGDVSFGKDPNQEMSNIAPTGMPIERLTNFTMTAGQTSALLPFLDKVTPSPKYGDTKILGTGSTLNYKWLEVFVNATRQAVIGKEGVMSDFRMAYLNNIQRAQEELRDLFIRFKNANITSAFYDGVSANIAEGLSTSKNGIGMVKRLHPNSYYVLGSDTTSGTVSEMGTAGKTKLTSDYDSAKTALSTTGKMTYKTLTALTSICREKKIEKVISAGGQKFWLLVVHSEQLKDLKADTDFLANERAVLSGGEDRLKNPIVSNVVTYCSEFAIYSDDTVVREWDATGKDFGDYWDETPTTASNFCAIVIGKSAVAYADPLSFMMTTEDYDHQSVLEFGGAMIDGANRYDYVAEADRASVFSKGNSSAAYLSSAYTAKNQSSLILMSL